MSCRYFNLVIQAFRDLIIRYLPNFRKKKYAFAFLVHPRNIEDTYRKYPFLKYFPEKFLFRFLRHYWPVVLSKVEGMRSLYDEVVIGYIITIPLTGHQILEDKEYARKKIIQAIKLAEKLGVKIIGLGALISSITKGGLDLVDKVKVSITNGNALTAAVSFEDIKELMRIKDMDWGKTTIAIVGATGSIGSVISKLCSFQLSGKLILIGRTLTNLENLKRRIMESNTKIKHIVISDRLGDISDADFVFIATNSNNIVIHDNYLKKGVVIYDITQPRITHESILYRRKDIVIIDGGLIKVNENINFHFDFGTPDKHTIFSCLGETMLLAGERYLEHFSLGTVNLEQIKYIYDLFQKYNFKFNRFTSFNKKNRFHVLVKTLI